jgi:arylsulfatase A-like enzyme
MTMQTVLRFFCTSLLLVSICPATRLSAADRPNVVILFTDDQGTLDAGCYGAKDLRTPNIDRLAASGVRFTQAYAHTVCCPSRAALLTGRHPQRGGVNSWTQGNMRGKKGINMALEEVTLAEALGGAGYRTALFGKWHLGSHRDYGPKKQGFDEFFGLRDGFIDNYNHHFLHGNGFHDLYEGTEEVWAKGKYFPELMVQRSVEFLEKNKSRPFFLYVAFNIPHYPEQALKEHEKLFADLPQPRRSYATVVATTDHYIGLILDKLESLGLREDTIVIFMSDNGHSAERSHIRVDNHRSGLPKGHKYGALGGGGFTGKWIGHKGTFLEGGVRVPAIVSYPAKLPKGAVRDQVITGMDWFPTVLDLCGVEKPDVKLDGKSLLPIVRSAEAPSPHKAIFFQWQSRWAVRQGDWKLLGRVDKKGTKIGLSLRSLAGETPEVKNHVEDEPDVVARLSALYDSWQADLAGEKRQGNPSADSEFVSIFDGKTLEGWHVVPKKNASDWSAQDGVILADGKGKHSYLLWHEDDLADFEIKFSYRMLTKGNTGMEIRCRKDKTGKRFFEAYHADLGHVGIGPEVLGAWDMHFAKRKEFPIPRGTHLVIDKNGKGHSTRIDGAIRLEEIKKRDWNLVHIIVKGYHLRMKINGKMAAELTDNLEGERLHKGAIGMQLHDKGMKVEFKDVQLKKL